MAKNKNLGRNVGLAIGGIAIIAIVGIVMFGNVGDFQLIQDRLLAGEVEFTLNRLVGETDTRGTTTGGTDAGDFFAISDFDPFTTPIGDSGARQGEIICKLKNTVTEIDRNRVPIRSIDSTGVSGAPFFQTAELISESGRSISGYSIEQKIFCESIGNFLGADFRNELMAWLGVVTHRAIDLNTGVVLASQDKAGASVVRFPNTVGELTFNERGWLPASSIESSLVGNQNINVRIETIGEVFVTFVDFPETVFHMVLFPNDVYVDFPLQVNQLTTTPVPPPPDDPITDPIPPELVTQNLACDFADGSASGIRDCKLACEVPTLSNTITGVWVVQTNNVGGQTQTIYSCDFTDQPPTSCPSGFRFDSTLNDCVEIPDCPVGFSFNSAKNTCEAQTTVIDIEEEVLKGSVISIVEVVFTDGKKSQTVARSGSGFDTQGFPDLQTDIGGLTPASIVPESVTPSGVGIAGKPISLIRIEMIYCVSPNTPENSFGLDGVALKMTPTVDESSVSMATGTSISFRSANLGSPDLITFSGLPLCSGFSLGNGQVTSQTLIGIGEDANILEGQAKPADIILTVDGSVTFTSAGKSTTFLLDESTITFKDFLINNSKDIVTDLVCTEGQVEEIDANGKVINCREPTPTDSRCFTPERPSGFACSPEFVEANCQNGLTACTEPDTDGDGVPDFKDRCKTLAEDGISSGLAEPDDGCPAPETPPPPTCTPASLCHGDEPPIVLPPVLCSEANPENCIFTPDDFENILIFGIIGIVGIGILAIVVTRLRRR